MEIYLFNQTEIDTWQRLFSVCSLLVSVLTLYFAYLIGKRQNEINSKALGLQDYAEIFFMPQAVVLKDSQGSENVHHWNILMKNASAYTIYISSYSLNNVTTQVGGSPIPTDSDNWYALPIPPNIDTFTLEVRFQDHNGRNYLSVAEGKFNVFTWSINSKRRITAE